jgi:hypothetical protein
MCPELGKDNCVLLLSRSDDACDRMMSRCGRQADEAKFAMRKKIRVWERWQKIGRFRRQIVGSQAMSGRRRGWRQNQREVVGVEEEELGHGWPFCWRRSSNKYLGIEAKRYSRLRKLISVA